MTTQEEIGKAISDLRSLYPTASAGERADIVFDHISKYGSPPIVLAANTTIANGTGAGNQPSS